MGKLKKRESFIIFECLVREIPQIEIDPKNMIEQEIDSCR